jgi:hypothetical protein
LGGGSEAKVGHALKDGENSSSLNRCFLSRVFPNAVPANDFEASTPGRTTTRNATPPYGDCQAAKKNVSGFSSL